MSPSEVTSEKKVDLNTVQRWFQAVITHPDGVEGGMADDSAQQWIRLDRSELEKVVSRSNNLTAEERVGIYANAYYARLLECMGESFSVLKRVVGDELFNEFAFGYLQRYPSQSYTLGKLTDRFADYLVETKPDDAPWADCLVDIARLEWTVWDVFDGPGIEKLSIPTAEHWQAIDPERFADTKLELSASMRLMQFAFPINDFYTDARRDEAGDVPDLPAPTEQWLAITRRDYVVRRYELDKSQYTLLCALQAGRPVGEAIEQAADVSDMETQAFSNALQRWFRQWAHDQFFQRIVTD